MIFIITVLPAPLGPITEWISPFLTFKSTPDKAHTFPKNMWISSSSRRISCLLVLFGPVNIFHLYNLYSECHSLFFGRSYIIIFINQGENIPNSVYLLIFLRRLPQSETLAKRSSGNHSVEKNMLNDNHFPYGLDYFFRIVHNLKDFNVLSGYSLFGKQFFFDPIDKPLPILRSD